MMRSKTGTRCLPPLAPPYTARCRPTYVRRPCRIQTERRQQRSGFLRQLKIGVVGVEVQDAALDVLVVKPDLRAQLFQHAATVQRQGDEPTGVSSGWRRPALAQKRETP